MNNKAEDVFESTADILFKSACSSAADSIFDETDRSMTDEEIAFSRRHTDAVERIFKNERNNKKRRRFRAELLLAAVVVITVILFSALAVYAFREKILNFFKEETRLGTVFHYEGDNEELLDEPELNVGFIPQDFEETQKYKDAKDCLIIYSHNEEYIAVDKMLPPDSYALDTEDAEIKYIDINGCQAMFSVNEDVSIITWSRNGYVFSVSGNVDDDILIKTARNIS